MRQGYDHQASPPVANGAYGHPYVPDHASHQPPPQYPYPGPPPPPGPAHSDSYYVQPARRGGRGGHRDGNSRGRGGHHHAGDRSRPHKQNHHNNHNNNQQKQEKKDTPAVAKKKKRKINTLGLTPGMDSESEDDEGEEKVLSDLIGKETLEYVSIQV